MFVAVDRVVSFLFFIFLAPPPLNIYSSNVAGPDATIAELTDFICAAQMAKAADASFPEEKVIPSSYWQCEIVNI